MNTYKIIRADDYQDLSRRTSQIIASHIDLILDQKERAQIAFPGGSTPSETYRLLSEEHLPWDRVDLFFGVERWVHQEEHASNAGMI